MPEEENYKEQLQALQKKYNEMEDNFLAIIKSQGEENENEKKINQVLINGDNEKQKLVISMREAYWNKELKF